jgi:anti-anti-sigma factor
VTKTPSPAQGITHSARSPGAMWDPQRKVVWLYGAQDSSTVPGLSAAIAAGIAFDEATLLLDLTDATSIDEAIVEVIVLARAYLRRRSRSLALRSATPSVRRVFVLCGLTELVDDAPESSADDAENSLPIQPLASMASDSRMRA